MTGTFTMRDDEIESEAARSSRILARDQIIAFFTGALFVGVGLIIAYVTFVGPNTHTLDPTAAWCRGWIDGLSYTDYGSGNEYDDATLDAAEAKCYAKVEAGPPAPGARGPLTVDS
jgi:hypothetical protein